MTEALLNASKAVSINCIVGATLTGTIFVLEMIAMYENRKSFTLTSAKIRWRLPLASCTFFAFCVYILDGITVWNNWIGKRCAHSLQGVESH